MSVADTTSTCSDCSLSPRGVMVVETVLDMQACQRALEHAIVVGIDAEWPPYMTSSGSPCASVVQLACLSVPEGSQELHKKTFVIDIDTVGDKGCIRNAFKILLKNSLCLKIGHSLDTDIKAVSLALDCVGTPALGAVEVTQLYTRLWHMGAPGLHGTFKMKGLSPMLMDVLGVSLDKTLQCSAWEKKPLSSEQVLYAANDAACLLDLFIVAFCMYRSLLEDQGEQKIRDLMERVARPCKEGGMYCLTRQPQVLEFDGSDTLRTAVSEFGQDWSWSNGTSRRISKKSGFWNASSAKGKQHQKKKKTGRTKVLHKILPQFIPWRDSPDPNVRGQGPRFICDVMLLGLARQLRLWGIDAEAAPTLSKWERYLTQRRIVEQAESENRVILTKDTIFYARRVSDQLYFVINETKKAQAEEIITVFDIAVEKSHLMSRCPVCNGEFMPDPKGPEELEAGHDVPPAVLERISEFWVCSKDPKHIYWHGGQYANAMTRLTNEFNTLFNL